MMFVEKTLLNNEKSNNIVAGEEIQQMTEGKQLSAIKEGKKAGGNIDIDFDLEGNEFPANSIELFKIDKEYFNALPNELKMDIFTRG